MKSNAFSDHKDNKLKWQTSEKAPEALTVLRVLVCDFTLKANNKIEIDRLREIKARGSYKTSIYQNINVSMDV